MTATIQALAGPTGQPSRSILTIGELSTGVDVDDDGRVTVELPHVAAALCLMLTRGDTAGVILRPFTDHVADITPDWLPRLWARSVKHLYAYGNQRDRLHSALHQR